MEVFGVIRWADGGKYEWDLTNDEKDDKGGVYTSADGSKYGGQGKNGKQHGIGYLYGANGSMR